MKLLTVLTLLTGLVAASPIDLEKRQRMFPLPQKLLLQRSCYYSRIMRVTLIIT